LVRMGLFDISAPVITHTVTGTLGLNGWYTSDVGLTWSVSEPESPTTLVVQGCTAQTISADQPAQDYSCGASSEGGGWPGDPLGVDSDVVSIKRDATPPTVGVTNVTSGALYSVGGAVPVAGCTTSDATSGVASDASVSVTPTDSMVGVFTATCDGAV